MANTRNRARRRAKRSGRRRELHTGIIGRLLIMVAVVAAIVLGVALFFRVRTIEVQGNSIYSWDQVANASGISPGDNLFMLNREAVGGSIQARLPYVQRVSVGRILPDTVVIQVEESQIAASSRPTWAAAGTSTPRAVSSAAPWTISPARWWK